MLQIFCLLMSVFSLGHGDCITYSTYLNIRCTKLHGALTTPLTTPIHSTSTQRYLVTPRWGFVLLALPAGLPEVVGGAVNSLYLYTYTTLMHLIRTCWATSYCEPLLFLIWQGELSDGQRMCGVPEYCHYMTPCSVIEMCRHFGERYCLHVQGICQT